MKLTVLKALLFSAFIIFFNFTNSSAQSNSPNVVQPTQPPPTPGPISGPTTVLQSQIGTYSVTAVSGASSYLWTLSSTSAGTVSGSGTSATVNWSSSYSGYAQVYCQAVNSIGSSDPSLLSVSVNSTAPVSVTTGSVTPASQTISYNGVPSTMTCTAATGGNGTYAYQWQSSTNNGTWTNISGATTLSYSPAASTNTTWYQVVTTSNGATSTSNSATVIVNSATNPSNIDTTVNSAMNHIFGTLNTAKIPTGLLRDYAVEFTNLENFNGVALADSNIINSSTFRQIYISLASGRMTSTSKATLPSPNIVDSLSFVARQPGQVTLSGLFYQYAYFDASVNPNPNITITNGQLFDKYVNGVWQNPYLQGQTVGFAPSTDVYNALNFKLLLPTNLWLTNSASLVSKIQIDAGDGVGYRTITPGTPLAVTYSSTGLKIWNFKLFLTSGTVLLSHSQITVNGTIDNLTCYTAGCSVYVAPGGGSSNSAAKSGVTTNAITGPADVISGSLPIYFFKTGATLNGLSAKGVVTVQLAAGHSTITNPLIVVEGFDPGVYLHPESNTGEYTLADFNSSVIKGQSSTLINLLESSYATYDIIFIDYKNGTDDIRRNALLVASVIRWVNANKSGTNKNTVLALSMGGLCARYALKKMENNGETHQVGLFVCHGSPQQGANVPAGLQDLEIHMNTLYFQAGVAKALYDAFRIFKPSKPNYDGVLSLSNTIAAQQMLVTHINGGFQVDNSIHNSWQTELTALGYPTQGNIKNVAISNGSECGQTQTLTQNGQILYLDGRLSTSFLGDLITEIGATLGAVASGQPSFLLGVLPGRNSLTFHFAANAAQDGGGNQAYNGKITYTKKVLWLLNVTSTLTNRTYSNPSGTLPYETFGGDWYPLPNIGSYASSGWFGKYNIILNIAPTMGFVTTASALDIGKGSTALSESDYLTPYSQATPPVAPKNTPFSNFITAYSPTSGIYSGSNNNNEQHISYEPRNGNWLASELNGSSTIADCSALCQINSISGPANNCNSVASYSVTSYSNIHYQWSVSSNLQVTSGGNTPTAQIQPMTGTNGQQGTITVHISSLDNPDCSTQDITKQISIGVVPLAVTSTVDRTPEASHYEYLTATATQLANTTPSNYSWYLLVNNAPTTQIGTGLTLNNYPIAPCKTIYYQCQAVTACGTSTYNGYAYNDYCSGSSATSDQSVVVYPNPADGTMSVSNNDIPTAQTDALSSTSTTPQNYAIKLYDGKGNVVRSAQNTNGSAVVTFPTKDIKNGHYFIHILKKGKVIERQVVIQH